MAGAAKAFLGLVPVSHHDDFHVGTKLRKRALFSDPSHQRVGIGKCVIPKSYYGTLGTGIQGRDVRFAAHELDGHDIQEVKDFSRWATKTVMKFRGKCVDVFLRVHVGEAAIEPETNLKIRDESFRDQHSSSDIDLRRPGFFALDSLLAGSQLHDGVLQHLLVELEAYFPNVTGLLFAQQVAGSANVEIMAGEAETGAERIQGLQDLEAFFGRRRKRSIGGNGEEGIGPLLRPSDAAAKLIELCQAEHVGAIHDKRIGGGDVEAGFYDGRRQEYVVFAVVEPGHDVLKFGRRQAAVRDSEPCFRHQGPDRRGDFTEIGNARHDEKALAAAIKLAQERFANDHGIEGRDVGSYSQAVEGRRGNQRQLANARQGQLERTGNGRRREREHVHIGLQL